MTIRRRLRGWFIRRRGCCDAMWFDAEDPNDTEWGWVPWQCTRSARHLGGHRAHTVTGVVVARCPRRAE